jgi:DNA-binding winged helix-turn-helix (wHTH) protein
MTPQVIPALESGMSERSNLPYLPGSRFMRFGPFQLDQQRQEVTKNGERLRLQGKVFQVLVALLEKPGEVVTREELRQRLWPADTHVNFDANVNTTVNKLRQALGDSTDKPLYIETIPRKGYCLVASSEPSEVSSTPVVRKSAAKPVSLVVSSSPPAEPSAPSSGFWVPVSVVGLILAGMLLGAGITLIALLLPHFAQPVR